MPGEKFTGDPGRIEEDAHQETPEEKADRLEQEAMEVEDTAVANAMHPEKMQRYTETAQALRDEAAIVRSGAPEVAEEEEK